MAGYNTPPRGDEIEVSVFGPGFGECIVVHPGGSEWLIVDSCLVGPPRKKVPVALKYLDDLGVGHGAVKLVVATHWHADHFRGIADIVKRCSNAKFVLSDALGSDEFLIYVKSLTPRLSIGAARHVAEMANALEAVRSRSFSKHARATAGLLLRQGFKPGYRVSALSPSPASVDRAIDEFAKLIPALGSPVRTVPAFKINDAAVAIAIEIGETLILLGSDVEALDDNDRGWKAILASDVRPPGRSQVYKVAHHGGRSGDSDEIWERLLSNEPVAVLTPWALGAKRLPTNDDRDRTLGRDGSSYATRIAGYASTPTQIDPAIRSFLAETTLTTREVDDNPGHVRLRKRISEASWRVELFNGAGQLADYDEAA